MVSIYDDRKKKNYHPEHLLQHRPSKSHVCFNWLISSGQGLSVIPLKDDQSSRIYYSEEYYKSLTWEGENSKKRNQAGTELKLTGKFFTNNMKPVHRHFSMLLTDHCMFKETVLGWINRQL